jgi:hypothetical protein
MGISRCRLPIAHRVTRASRDVPLLANWYPAGHFCHTCFRSGRCTPDQLQPRPSCSEGCWRSRPSLRRQGLGRRLLSIPMSPLAPPPSSGAGNDRWLSTCSAATSPRHRMMAAPAGRSGLAPPGTPGRSRRSPVSGLCRHRIRSGHPSLGRLRDRFPRVGRAGALGRLAGGLRVGGGTGRPDPAKRS